MVAGLPVPPKSLIMTADRGTSALNFEMIEHLFHLQGDETPTLRRKLSEKHKCRSKRQVRGCCFAAENNAGYELETFVALWK